MSERESDAWFALERAVREMAMELPPSDLASTRAIQHVTRFIERRETHLREVNAALVAALRAHEAWEGDIILNADWSVGTPRLTQEQIDAVIAVQEKRNAALAAAEPRGDGGQP